MTVKGNVVRVAGVRPLVKRMAFVCPRCGETVTCHFVDGKYEPPNACPGNKCRSRVMLPDRASAVTVDWQKIRYVMGRRGSGFDTNLVTSLTTRIQEIELAHQDAGRIPRTVECELTQDLVDACVPGDVVREHTSMYPAQPCLATHGVAPRSLCLGWSRLSTST